ncbi:MAG: hemolysin family protein [Planctomycetota bacterium]
MTGVLVVALLTLAASFFCSLFEAALYSITPSQIAVLERRGVRGARRLQRLRIDIDEPIAAILTINTVAHTLGSTVAGAMVASSVGSQWVGTFAAVFTFLVLTVTEIVPKSLGVRYAASIGPSLAWPLQLMIWAAYPIAHPAKVMMSKLAGNGQPGPSEDEVEMFSRLAAEYGSVRRDEHRWVQNALRLDRVKAKDLRTPRTVVETQPADAKIAQLAKTPAEWSHSRVPIVEDGGLDQIVGMVYRRDVFDAALRGDRDLTLRDLSKPLTFVPENMPANELLDHFLAERIHMVALADEFGGFEGVVTLEDVLECLLGTQIVDEHDVHDDLQELARRNPRAADSPDASTASEDDDAEAPAESTRPEDA